jgi:hypothetical protein
MHLRPGAEFGISAPGGYGHLRDGTYGGYGLAAKTEGGYGREISVGGNLGCTVPLKTEQHIIFIHALSIVNDPNKAGAAAFDLDLDSGGSGIEAVFQQLFHNGSGAFDNFPGGYLVGKLFWQYADFGHEKNELELRVQGYVVEYLHFLGLRNNQFLPFLFPRVRRKANIG